MCGPLLRCTFCFDSCENHSPAFAEVISRLHALAIATAYLLSVDDQVFTPEEVLTIEEWHARKVAPPLVYGHTFENDWIVRLRRKEGWRIEPSTVVCVERDTGEVTYHGAVFDEG